MTVFVAHAPADSEAAEDLERHVERRGHFVELDDGQVALRPVEANDVVVLLTSEQLLAAPERFRLEQRAFDAWAEGRLVLVKLDQSAPSVGLRDIPAVAILDRPIDWSAVAEAIRGKLSRPPPRRSPGRVGGWLRGLALLLCVAAGAAAAAVAGAIWLVNRIGPTPGGWPELYDGLDQFGMRYGLPGGVTAWIVLALIGLGVSAAAILTHAMVRSLVRLIRKGTMSGAIFVSYAGADQETVLPVIEAARRMGRKLRAGREGETAAADTVQKLVQTVRTAAEVVVMCSRAAFESDAVKREVYLADRFGKRLAPVYVEQAEPPPDFKHFFAGAEGVKLYEKPETERPHAFVRVLGAAA